MTSVEELLDDIRSVATDEHDKGDKFEQLMLHAFKTDRTFRQQFTDVWRWMDWPGRSGADIGIDLVARDAEGRLVAIQCKCYEPATTLTKDEIDSFVALSGQKQWSRRIIVATTDLCTTKPRPRQPFRRCSTKSRPTQSASSGADEGQPASRRAKFVGPAGADCYDGVVSDNP